MKKLLLIFIYMSNWAFAQTNLVPNWSFEELNSCPNSNTSDCHIAPPTIPALKDWFCALTYELTPDYFNVCNASSYSIPSNGWGNQLPNSGNAYIGGITQSFYSSNVTNNSEYIECKLKDSLKPNVTYCVNYFVSRADKRDYASSNFGALFTNTEQNTEYQISIYNNNGQLIQAISNRVLPYTYNLKNLVSGLYNVIFTGKTESSSAKFIKE